MKITLSINGKEINIHIDFQSSGICVTKIDFFNQKSFMDSTSMYTYRPDDNDVNDDCEMNVTVHQNDINTYSDIINQGCGYNLDTSKDLVIMQISLEYDIAYAVGQCCHDTPECVTVAVYDKCSVYTKMMNSIDSVYQNCADLSQSEFVNLVLQKKIIDTCIDSKHFSKACDFWERFNYGKSSYIAHGGCNCHG